MSTQAKPSRRVPGQAARRHWATALALGACLAAPAAWADEGAVVVRDAQTGRLRAPTAQEFKALKERDAKAAALRPVAPPAQEYVRRNGAVGVKVDPSLMTYSVMTRQADGKLREQCVTGEHSAHSLVAGATSEEHSHDHE